jgi:hypothetical protein
MSNPAIKRTAIELALGVGLCAAAFIFGLKPLERKLDEARAKVSSLESQIAAGTSDTLTVEQTVEMISKARQSVRQTRERSGAARDEGATFGAIMNLASKHGVRVDQLQPASARPIKNKAAEAPAPVVNPTTQAAAQSSTSAPTPALAPPADRRAACAMTVTGDYASVVEFVRAIERELGFGLVRSVRLTPVGDTSDQRVSCAIETEHLAIDTSSAKFADAASAREDKP